MAAKRKVDIMHSLKTLIGWIFVLLAATSCLLGLYFSIWIFFIGGLVNCFDSLKAVPTTDSVMLATGLAKLVFSWMPTLLGIVGTFIFANLAKEFLD